MNKELLGIGRGYLFGILALALSAAMVFTGDIIADRWMNFAQWLVPIVIGAKAVEKFATKKSSKQEN